VAGRLRLRRGVVVGGDPLVVEVDGERRPAWIDRELLGEAREGDEVVVNVAARDLGLGSGGFDVVHVNLSRGLDAPPAGDAHVMKLNYTSLQHPVEPAEPPLPARGRISLRISEETATSGGAGEALRVLVIPLHGHLAPAAWAAARAEAGARVGYVQTAGGALPGALSRDVAELRRRGLLCGHVTAGAAYGGEAEAISVPGALEAAAELGWDAAIVGPGPGIIGSETELGHGGLAALENAHAALALRMRALLSPRLSSADPRDRHRGLSHHTRTVLDLLLAPVDVAVPAGEEVIAAALELAAAGRHRLRVAAADVAGYADSGLPRTTMGRDIEEDRLFFAAPLAAGRLLAI
jgi:hypothetical protein